MLVEQRNCLLRDVFVLKLRVLNERVHLGLQQEQVVALLLARAELVEELVDFVSSLLIVLDVHVDQSCLDERHNIA